MSTFQALTNQLLRRLNENEIGSSEWSSTRGVQSLAKDAIQAAVRKINFVEFEWPFNASEHSVVLTQGQNEYVWPDNFKVVDWNSFQIQADPTLGVTYTQLKYTDRDVWYNDMRDNDYEHLDGGRGVPYYVFESHGEGFGVSPNPNAPYVLKFKYYKIPVTMAASSDQSGIPEQYDDIIIQAGLHHMYMFRGNSEQAQIAENIFNQMLDSMTSVLIHKIDRVRSTVIARWNNG